MLKLKQDYDHNNQRIGVTNRQQRRRNCVAAAWRHLIHQDEASKPVAIASVLRIAVVAT